MDSRNRANIRARIRRIHDELRATTIYVTHDQEEAVALADKVIVMNLGVIQQTGTVDELWNHPKNLFVAGFIGEPSMNFLPAKIEFNGTVAVMAGENGVCWEFSKNVSSDSVGSEVIVGVRPDKVNVSREPSDSALKTKVTLVEFQGENKILTLKLGKKHLNAVVPSHMALQDSQYLWLSTNPQHIHVFDKDTGAVLTQ